MHEAGDTEEAAMKQQQRMNMRRISAKGRMDENNSRCVSELLAVGDPTQRENTNSLLVRATVGAQ